MKLKYRIMFYKLKKSQPKFIKERKEMLNRLSDGKYKIEIGATK